MSTSPAISLGSASSTTRGSSDFMGSPSIDRSCLARESLGTRGSRDLRVRFKAGYGVSPQPAFALVEGLYKNPENLVEVGDHAGRPVALPVRSGRAAACPRGDGRALEGAWWEGLKIIDGGCYRNGSNSRPVLARNPTSSPGRYCIRLSRVFTSAVSSAIVCLVGLPSDRFRCAHTASPGFSSWAYGGSR